jgi:hypothetical protein
MIDKIAHTFARSRTHSLTLATPARPLSPSLSALARRQSWSLLTFLTLQHRSRLAKAILECVILAGSSHSDGWWQHEQQYFKAPQQPCIVVSFFLVCRCTTAMTVCMTLAEAYL